MEGLNRKQRRALKHRKMPAQKPLKRLHQVLLSGDNLPRVDDDPDRIVQQKIVMLNAIAALKDGTFGYNHLCQLHDFTHLALLAAEQFQDKGLQVAGEDFAAAVLGIMERKNNSGRYGANGDELRTLQAWVEEITEYMGRMPEAVIRGLIALHKENEDRLRTQIAAKLAKGEGQ